jgi:hypothetical protein
MVHFCLGGGLVLGHLGSHPRDFLAWRRRFADGTGNYRLASFVGTFDPDGGLGNPARFKQAHRRLDLRSKIARGRPRGVAIEYKANREIRDAFFKAVLKFDFCVRAIKPGSPDSSMKTSIF